VLETLIQSIAFLLLIESALIAFLIVGADTTSLIRFSMYIGTILAGLLVAVTYKFDDVVTTFFWTSVFFLIVHFLLFPFLYKTIIYDDLYLDRTTILGTTSYGGLFSKEGAGEAFALSSIVAFSRCFQREIRWTARLVLAGSLFALLLTGAMGPLLSLILAFGVAIQIQGLYSKHKTIAFFSIPSTICLALVMYYLVGIDQLFGLFNRSADFTGRDILFQLWPRFFAQHPIFGYGFNGFFNGLPGSPEEQLSNFMPQTYMKFVTWESCYIEILIQLGTVGGILFFLIFLKAFSNALYFSNHDKSESRYVPITMLLFMLFCNAAEASLMLQNSIQPLLLFWIYFGCGRKARDPTPNRFLVKGLSARAAALE